MPLPVSQQIVLVFVAIILRDQDIAIKPVPGSCPIFVGPNQAERQVNVSVFKQNIERLLHEPLTVEEVVVNRKPVNAVGFGELGLCAQIFDIGQVIKAEVAWDTRLAVTCKARQAMVDLRPLGEAGPPPFVVFFKGVKLWQVKGQSFSSGAVR